MGKMKEGWTKIVNVYSDRETKLHYFRGGSSLCGKYILFDASTFKEFTADARLDPRLSRRFSCITCLKLLREGRAGELEKHSQTFEQRKMIEEFLDWLCENKILLGEYIKPFKDSPTERLAPLLGNRQELLDKYFDIDPVQLEKERRELLEQAGRSKDG